MAKIIGVDFDDVLMACNEALCVWHNANYGTSYAKKIFFHTSLIVYGDAQPKTQSHVFSDSFVH